MLDKTIEIVDRAGGWMLYQIDNNDFLAGFVFATTFVTIPYLLGVIDIVVR